MRLWLICSSAGRAVISCVVVASAVTGHLLFDYVLANQM